MRAMRALVLGLALSVSASSALRADFTQQPDETLPGFKSQQVYDFNGVDNVNLFSGELHLAIPLGPEYPLSSGLTWRLTAHYSSKYWRMWLANCGGNGSCPGRPEYAHRAQLGGTSTLGVGWTLELGSIRPPVFGEGASYKAPDGSTHFGQSTGNPDPNAGLRLDPRLSDGSYVVRQTNGTALYFEHLYSIPALANGYDFTDENRSPANFIQNARYGLSRIVDRFGRTVLRVTYQANCAAMPCPANAWKVASVQIGALAKTVTFNWRTYAGSGTFDVLDSIEFPVADSASLFARFDYLGTGILYRAFDFDGSQACTPPGPAQTNVPFLKSITQGTQTFTFLNDSPGGGLLQALTFPTGGTVSYQYQRYTVGTPGVCSLNCASPEIGPGGCAVNGVVHAGAPFATLTDPNNCDDMSYYMQFTDASPAVVTRTETGLPNELPGGAAVVSITNYERESIGSPLVPGTRDLDDQRVVRRVLVHRTDGNGNALTDKYIFSAGVGVQQGAELSHRTYTNCNGADPPVRSTVQCFRRPDSSNACGVMETPTLIHNLYLVDLAPSRRETWYGANPIPDASGCATDTSVPCWQDESTGWDQAALEYRTVTRSSPSGVLFAPQGATRTTTTNWTPTAPGAVPWLPKLSSYKTVTDAPCVNAPCSVTTQTSFDASTGFLLWSKTTDPVYGELKQTYTPDPATGDPVAESLSATFDGTIFTNRRTYQSGLTTSVRRIAPSYVGWASFDATRNPYTGRIAASRDPNGLTTSYGWDGLSRLTSVGPPEETPTTYCYLDWSSTQEMSAVYAKKGGAACAPDDGAPGVGSGPFEAYQYDGIGRVKREIRRLPNALDGGGTFAFREHRYNSAGLKSFESEWTPCGTAPSATSARSCSASFATRGTTYANFDFLGRPRTILLADGSTVTKSFDDPAGIPNSDGTELVSRSVSGVTVNAASRKDVLGRLLLAAEPAPAPAPFGRYTGYYYNVLDKIASLSLPLGTGDPANDPPVTAQVRTFAYDAFGFLRTETHPEKGTTVYAAYNALGEVTAKNEGGNAYAYEYDALGRLKTTKANGDLYLSNVYDTDVFGGGVPGNRYVGKLAQQNAYHPLSDRNLWVAHNFGYGGLGGRLSVDDHWAILGGSVLFHVPTSYSWNGLGLLARHDHARSAGAWNVSTAYVSGLPASVTANDSPFVTDVAYNAAGGLLSYRTANGVTTTIDPDSSLMPRPQQIRTSGADVNFSTGAYRYDGSGNISTIGSDVFRYDARGHLARADYYQPPGSPYDAYTYDAYGNQTRRGWESGLQDLTTDTGTNRLAAATYDALGNLKVNGPDRHSYDALSRQTLYVGPGANERYYYDGAGERLARVVFASSLPVQSVQESFFNLTPCRILDTRSANGALGGPAIPGQGSRSFAVTGACGIPSNAKALALNVTTVPSAATAATGNVRLFPTGLSYTPLGTSNAYKSGYVRANQVYGSIDGPAAGSFTLFNDAAAGTSVDVVVDVQGYFAPGPAAPLLSGDSWFLTIRDLEKRPSTEFRYDSATGQTAVLKDYVYLGSQLVGTYTTTGTPNGTVFYTNDHLGSPRFLTAGASPTKLAEYRYRAFGLALSSTIPGQGPEFASMERDLASSDLYDHARYVGGKIGRFKSPDQLGGHPEDPQSWNRYAYARNNPVRMVDPTGKSSADAIAEARVRRDIQKMDGAEGIAAYDRGANTAAAITVGVAAIGAGGAFITSFLALHPAVAIWMGALGLGMAGEPTPHQVIQGVANQVSGELAANPGLAKTVLSQAEYAAGQKDIGIARMGFGKAIERLMGREVAKTPSLSRTFRHVGGPHRPDFVGRIGSDAAGMRFEVTTPAAVAAHQGRPYGADLQFVVYERPESFRLFP